MIFLKVPRYEDWCLQERQKRPFEDWRDFNWHVWMSFISRDETSKKEREERRGFSQSIGKIDAYPSNVKNVMNEIIKAYDHDRLNNEGPTMVIEQEAKMEEL